MVESDWGKWVVKSAFGIVKHGGPRGDFDHNFFGRVSHGPRPRPIMLWSRGREDLAFAFALCF
ncbi:unnamed protein product [Prunus brigantina]